ncbi:hypothetical protein PV08_09061 [Exophiala spinifera]|uniref:Carboxypeptidase n=1 Tax=Exophiala spinifera TaxID=91928 RepID=A0A0D2BKI8_9EURO|nr:uncharacterized protein PV08_09061 [Exophiala spinifera]KIW11789.1 hypothetical protein PV08_09061 [Exophiala spinifera]
MALKRQWLNCIFVGLYFLFPTSLSQYPPPLNESLTTIHSPINPNITIKFKAPSVGTCTTVFATQKQVTGYITLPPNVLDPSPGNYTINTFFWFIEARQVPEAAPLTIYINGGPGSSSMVGLFQEVGPCRVVEIAEGQLGTVARDWGWDRSSNILFIDQPVQVGFSFDTLTNLSLNLLDEVFVNPPAPVPLTQPGYTFLNGTFGSGSPSSTANTSQIAAQSLWYFLQTFLTSFPEYNTGVRSKKNTSSAEIHLFTESFGGRYGPAFGHFIRAQNTRRSTDAEFANSTTDINLVSLGIINGWIDLLVQTPFHPKYAYENTYGIEAINQLEELNALSAYNSANGCQQRTLACRAQEAALDPSNQGNVVSVNQACSEAQLYCQTYVVGAYISSNRSVYDISQNRLDPFPDSFYLEYLNQLSFQQAINVPVNYTQDSLAVFSAFASTGDYARDGIVQDLVSLLGSGVRVALMYGDRDYICNWLGGEAASFAIAGAAGSSYLPWFAAGYAPIVTNSSYVGGVVRQYGNLSFSRIYDAGHLVPAYQPETAFTVFSRIINGDDISTGNPANLSKYRSMGDRNATFQNSPPPMAAPTCFRRAVNETCDTDQKNMLANGAGVLINGVLYDQKSDWQSPAPDVASIAGAPGTARISMATGAPSSSSSSKSTSSKASVSTFSASQTSKGKTTTTLPTGVYTATDIPPTSSAAKSSATASSAASTRMRRAAATGFSFLSTHPLGTALVYVSVLCVFSDGILH